MSRIASRIELDVLEHYKTKINYQGLKVNLSSVFFTFRFSLLT